MKKSINLLAFILIGIGLYAQAPQKLSYQCVVRNSAGTLVANHAVGIRISVLQGSVSGTVVYQETFNTLTNGNGLATIEIGNGTPVSGNFSTIPWSSGNYYLRTETDPTGGTSYSISGTSQLESVPYALHAKSAASYSETDPVFGAAPAKNITNGNITNWNSAYSWGNHAGLYRPAGWVPAWNDVTGKPAFATVATSGSYNDLINKPIILNSQWTSQANNIYYTNGNVAIGMNSPRYQLTIYDANRSSIGFYNSTSGTSGTDGFEIRTEATGSPVWIWNWENSNIHFGTNNQRRMDILADGNIVMKKSLNINTEGTFGALYVQDKQALWWDGTYFSWGYDAVWNYFADRISIGRAIDPGGSYMLYVQGTAYATGTWSSSDASFKKNISTIGNSLDRLMKIRGTRFEFRTDEFKDYQFARGPQYGFIAQELEKEFPEVVKTERDGYKSVNYNGMIPVLLEAIKEQQKIIDQLKAENSEMELNQQTLHDRLSRIENAMNLNQTK